jgi:hypothetical protein
VPEDLLGDRKRFQLCAFFLIENSELKTENREGFTANYDVRQCSLKWQKRRAVPSQPCGALLAQ